MLNKEPLTAGLTSIYRGGAEDERWTTAPGEEGAVETNEYKKNALNLLSVGAVVAQCRACSGSSWRSEVLRQEVGKENVDEE